MRKLMLLLALAASACASVPSRGIDWHVWTDEAVASGLMKDTAQVRGGSGLSSETLVTSFDKIGFSFETRTIGVRNRTGDRHKVVRKWQRPLNYAVVSPTQMRDRVQVRVDEFLARIANITGHPITAAGMDGLELLKWGASENLDDMLVVMFGDDDFYRDISRGLRPATRNIRRFVDRWRLSASPCAGFVRHGSPSQPFTGPLSSVVIAIRDEMPDRLLTACIEEELAQSMGLFNDDPSVTPSLFNDDQEYGVLTKHDELLLRILYDKRLHHGMPRANALPIVREIARELLPDA